MSLATRRGRAVVASLVVVALLYGGARALRDGDGDDAAAVTTTTLATPTTGAPTTSTAASTAPSTTAPSTTWVARTDVLVDPASFGRPYGTTVPGVLTFRGNPTRSFYGTGPMPTTAPTVQWEYPGNGTPMCAVSKEYGVPRTWCGTGWTGQPAVFERDGRTWLVFGAYDDKVHFVDADTGEDIIPPFVTGDLAKGNVTVDPDGYPLVYAGSRDNHLYVIAFDGDAPRELWKLNARTPDRLHNDDWDAAPLVLGDYLVEGAENSWFHGVRLHRAYAADGSVTVAPEVVFRVPGWDDQLIRDLGAKDPKRVSLEASVSVSGDTAWLNSSGGLLQGWDISGLRTGTSTTPTRTFRFWTGDDSDATVVPGPDGDLYVGVEVDRDTARGRELGQLLRIDPSRPDDPVVWGIDVDNGVDSGTWATPIVTDSVVIWNTKPGRVYGIDRTTGAILWKMQVAGPVLSSPVLVDGVLLQGDGAGRLHAWDAHDPRTQPTELWTVQLDANIESTPVVWKGRIYLGTRGGFVRCLAVNA